MLLKDFYTVEKLTIFREDAYGADIIINAGHEVFSGHFPGNPVTPGVCMIQIIKEITQQVLKAPLTLTSAVNVKFTAIINPNVTPNVSLAFEIVKNDKEDITIKNTATFNDTVALKLTCSFSKNTAL